MQAKEFIYEVAHVASTAQKLREYAGTIGEYISRLGNVPVLYRAIDIHNPKIIHNNTKHRGPSPASFLRPTRGLWPRAPGDRESAPQVQAKPDFRPFVKIMNDDHTPDDVMAGTSKYNMASVLRALNISNPIFTVCEKPVNTSPNRFGQRYIFVPPPNAKAVWSNTVADIGTHIDYDNPSIEDLVSTYRNGFPPTANNKEVIVDADYYYLIDLQAFLGAIDKRIFDNRLNKDYYNISKQYYDFVPTTYADISRYLTIHLDKIISVGEKEIAKQQKVEVKAAADYKARQDRISSYRALDASTTENNNKNFTL